MTFYLHKFTQAFKCYYFAHDIQNYFFNYLLSVSLNLLVYGLSSSIIYFHSLLISIIMHHHIIISTKCSDLFFISFLIPKSLQPCEVGREGIFSIYRLESCNCKGYQGYQLMVPRQDSKAFCTAFGFLPTTYCHHRPLYLVYYNSSLVFFGTTLSPLKSF